MDNQIDLRIQDTKESKEQKKQNLLVTYRRENQLLRDKIFDLEENIVKGHVLDKKLKENQYDKCETEKFYWKHKYQAAKPWFF